MRRSSPITVDDDDQHKSAELSRVVDLWRSRKRRVFDANTIRFHSNFNNTIYDVMVARGWQQTDSETDWDFLWVDRTWMRTVYERVHLDSWQRVNHFRAFYELCRSVKNLSLVTNSLKPFGITARTTSRRI